MRFNISLKLNTINVIQEIAYTTLKYLPRFMRTSVSADEKWRPMDVRIVLNFFFSGGWPPQSPLLDDMVITCATVFSHFSHFISALWHWLSSWSGSWNNPQMESKKSDILENLPHDTIETPLPQVVNFSEIQTPLLLKKTITRVHCRWIIKTHLS